MLRLIEEFRGSGRLELLERLEQVYPAESAKIRRLPQMTPLILRALKGELGVDTTADLIAAIEAGGVEALKGVGPRAQSAGRRRSNWRLRLRRSHHFRPTCWPTPSAGILAVTSAGR